MDTNKYFLLIRLIIATPMGGGTPVLIRNGHIAEESGEKSYAGDIAISADFFWTMARKPEHFPKNYFLSCTKHWTL